MIYSELKDFEEILKLVKEENSLFLAGCNGCAEVCKTGGSEVVEKISEKLKEAGKEIKGKVIVDFLCSKNLIVKKMRFYLNEIMDSSGILVFSCGIGVQCVSAVVDKPVYPATNTVYLGGFQGLWPGKERCAECGTCYLGITGGICPITFCTKQLVNGPCGGTNDGKCEIDPEKPCGWALIYERLKKINKLELLREYQNPRDFKKMEVNTDLRRKVFFDIDKNEEV